MGKTPALARGRGCTDLRVTEGIAAKAEADTARIRAGIIDPRERELFDQGKRSLAEHLSDWQQFLLDRGVTTKHANLSLSRAARLLALASGAGLVELDAPNASRPAKARASTALAKAVARTRLADLTTEQVQAALATLRGAGVSLESLNGYIRAAKGFSRWLWRIARRTPEDTLAYLVPFNSTTDRRHERRALTPAEVVALVVEAERGRVLEGVAGETRAMVNRVALGTGYRAHELRSLTPESFQLDQKPPTVVCKASATKNGQQAFQPIAASLANTLRPWLATKKAEEQVFNLPPVHTPPE